MELREALVASRDRQEITRRVPPAYSLIIRNVASLAQDQAGPILIRSVRPVKNVLGGDMLKQVLEVVELVDRPRVTKAVVQELFASHGLVDDDIDLRLVQGDKGETLVVKLQIPGARGGRGGGDAPTLGILGYLGGVGARPEITGWVSDGDGAVTALAAGLKLADMHRHGDRLPGDVIVATHICTNAPTVPHQPVPFMGSPVGIPVVNRELVDSRMDGIVSIDTTKGNRVINRRGFAISPTVKEGYILRVDEELLSIQQQVTGQAPSVFALTTQDITPYGNGLYHLNSILQPSTATRAPVVGIALTAEVAVPGCATGASQEIDIEQAARFSVEAAKAFTAKRTRLYDPEEFSRLVSLYGSMAHLQTQGQQ